MISPGLAHYQRLFGAPREPRRKPSKLDRGSLPTPSQYLKDHDLLTKKARGESASIRCPSHKSGDESHPSMLVALADGHYCCMTCGEKGGDILALHRLRTGLGFQEAVLDLGARFHD